ncbi:lipoyl(octanoyl) transferase [Natronincola peptidivorans]|uniref:Octanoyltransferase n=1 Tax=Natronincola peptidivorans TaxID=426128 RepID=A0A1I0BPJ3_9FIRM|nr:lipoyl(octanoyl) transferase LipB [Natronincola peptidivorans]SET08233.1 lipoyl(octanoyl) transferase [Natronincola peptidivorans]
MKLNVVKLGVVEYQTALDLQLKINEFNQQGVIEDILLLLEHPPVITIGVNGKNNNNILVNKEFLADQGVDIHQSSRGGDVTYHGPGQIVGYPIINLNYFGKDVREYVRRLEEVFIQLLQEEYKLLSNRSQGHPGIWIGNDKITALGCSVKRWVTMHGFAFNVNTNLEHFQWINPCGFTDRGVTSLQKELDCYQDMEIVMKHVIKHFAASFHFDYKILEQEALFEKLESLSKQDPL